MFPVHRGRRLRYSEALRDMVRETSLSSSDFILPLFVEQGRTKPVEIESMPGQMRHSLDSLVRKIEQANQAGIKGVMLFGIPEAKDHMGSGAFAQDGIIQEALRRLKKEGFPLMLITDVCMCEYTSHGHCGVIKDQDVDNDPSLELISQTALSQVQAGADMVAPSDMMDGRIAAIRQILDDNDYPSIPIMSYAAKYASAYYGPFRAAADSAPEFGDRRSYQMDPGNWREALKEIEQDIDEGADIVMVKPALAYMDIIRMAKDMSQVPVAAYNVSGEYAMIEFAAQAGVIDRKKVALETLLSLKRAGADIILTYHAIDAAQWLQQD